MKKNSLFVWGILLLLAIFMAGCGADQKSGASETDDSNEVSQAGGEEKYVLQLGHNAPVESAVGVGAEKLKELVEEKTDGRVTIEIFPNAELGDEISMIENMGMGINEMVVTGDGMFGTFFPEYEGLLLPFLIEDSAHMDRVYNSEIGDEMNEVLLNQVNSRILGTFHRGGRNLTANKEISSPEDLDGFKLRLPPISFIESAWREFGANPTPLDFGELYIALQQGTVDGQENPVDPIFTSNFFEVQSHLMLTEHTHSPLFFLINEDVYQGFPDDVQTQFDEAVAETIEYQNQRLLEKEKEMIEGLKAEGMNVVEVDRDVFKSVIEDSGVADKFEDQWAPDLVKRVRELQ